MWPLRLLYVAREGEVANAVGGGKHDRWYTEAALKKREWDVDAVRRCTGSMVLLCRVHYEKKKGQDDQNPTISFHKKECWWRQDSESIEILEKDVSNQKLLHEVEKKTHASPHDLVHTNTRQPATNIQRQIW